MTQETSPFAAVPLAPADPILGLTEGYNADQNPRKANLGVGVYQDGEGKVPVLATVREAEERWYRTEQSKGYLPIDGVPAYNRAVQGLVLGASSPAIAAGRAVTVQGLGGTGALRVGADLLRRFAPDARVWLSRPSWENHRALFTAAGFDVLDYAYYDAQSHGLDFEAMVHSLQQAPAGDIVVLHACCHNPTGVDPTRGQWRVLLELCRSARLVPFLDFAYQGFGEGIEEDAFAARAFAEAGIPCLIANSFSKSFSLYRERVGGLTVLTADAGESKRVLSQLKRVIRTNYSSPPSHGAQTVALALADSELRPRWEREVAAMRERIQAMRALFVRTLREQGVERDFSFVERQRGMFSYSGLSRDAVHRLRGEYGIYIVDSGRICVAAMNEGNIGYICEAIAHVLRDPAA